MIHSDRYTILKYSGYALLMLGLFVLQTSRGTAIHLWGTAVNAMPFFVAAVALLDGPYAGGVLGFCSLLLGMFGVGFGLFGAHYLRPVILSALSGGLVCMVVESVFRYVFHDLLMYGMSLPEALGLFGARLLLSLPVGALTWLLVRSIYRRFAEDSQ